MISFSSQKRHKTLFEKAAAYAFFIIKNHPFVDGNKRTGLHCALVFLYLNGIEIEIDQKELKDFAAILALHAQKW